MKKMNLLMIVIIFMCQALVQAQENRPKVLFVLTSHTELPSQKNKTGFWLSELTHPYYEVLQSSVAADIVSISGGDVAIEPRSMKNNDAENEKFLKESSELLKNTKALVDVNPDDYKAVFYVGGHGAMWDFTDSAVVNTLSRRIYENGGVVASVCHGPAALVNIKLSNGKYLIADKNVAGFTNDEERAVNMMKVVPYLLEDKLVSRGAKFTKASVFKEHVVVDQRVVTGQNPASARNVGREMVKLIK